MPRLLIVTLWVVVVTACDRGRPSAAIECAATADALVKNLSRDLDPAKVGTAKTTFANRCVEGRWTAEARACLNVAKSHDDLDDCSYKHLPGEQAERLKDAVSSVGKPIDNGEAFRAMTRFKDMMCACKDAKCAQDVSDEMTKWSQEQAKNQKEPPRMTEEEMKKFAELGEAMGGACRWRCRSRRRRSSRSDTRRRRVVPCDRVRSRQSTGDDQVCRDR